VDIANNFVSDSLALKLKTVYDPGIKDLLTIVGDRIVVLYQAFEKIIFSVRVHFDASIAS